MARGHAPKREAKKPKKKDAKKALAVSSDLITSDQVGVVAKKRKPRDDDF